MPLPRSLPRPAGVTAMWALTDFGPENGGTRVVPGSHRRSLNEIYRSADRLPDEAISPRMKPGDVLVFEHALFHAAGLNRSDAWRLGVQVNYQAGWLRSYTDWERTLSAEEMARLPANVRALVGHSMCGGLGRVSPERGAYLESYY